MRIVLMAVVTLDGKLARTEAQFVNWSSKEDKRLFMQTTKAAGVVIMGDNTYKTMAQPLPGRLHIVLTTDRSDKTDQPGVVEFTSDAPPAIVAGLAARGYTTAVLGGGSQINSLFLQHDLVDEIWLTVEPRIFGVGINLLSGTSFDLRARLIHLEQLNPDTVHLRYSLREPAGKEEAT
jgi:dihydrofolate reductase